MTIRTALTVALVSGVFASGAFAQDQQSQSSINAEKRDQKGPRPNSLNLPTSPILPMTNPIAPMTTAPVQPFVRYQGPQGTPTVVVPPAKTEDKGRDRRSNRNDNNVPVVIVGGYLPYYDSVIYQPPLLSPAPVPGQLPNTYPVNAPDPTYVSPAPTPGVLPPADPTPVTEYYPDSHVIITPEPPALTVSPPALGITRTATVAQYGEPWGSITMRGRETLYFRGGLVVVFEDSRAVEVR